MGTEQQDKTGDSNTNPEQPRPKREPWWFNQPNPIDRFTGWLVAVTLLLCIATVINAYILWITDHTLRDTLEANNRAWIAITAAVLESNPALDQPIQVRLHYRNSGQSPALKLSYAMRMDAIAAPTQGQTVDLTGEDFCKTVPFPGGGTLFPSSESVGGGFPTASLIKANAAILSGAVILVWKGCFRYETYGRHRQTDFCYWLRKDGIRWGWQDCGVKAN